MIQLRRYEYDLALTSQFYFCSLPLRFDTYSKCQFGCSYCFASSRGGARPTGLKASDTDRLARRLARLDEGREPRSVVDEFLQRRMPVHLGGMSDPFPPLERGMRVTERSLQLLAAHDVPTIISTKGTLCAERPWIDLLKSGRFLVQMSFSTQDDCLAERLEPSTPSPSARFEALAALADQGVATACRLQPFFSWRLDEALEIVDRCGKIGTNHFALEHLKLPVDSTQTLATLSQALDHDLAAEYGPGNALPSGREWILTADRRLDAVNAVRERAHSRGMTFGAADTDLLHLGDGEACCSGADLLWPDVPFFRHNFATAVQKNEGGLVTRSSVSSEWLPTRSIANAVNSHSRLPASGGVSPPLRSYIDRHWNPGASRAHSPAVFHGVRPTGSSDADGFEIYEVKSDVLARMSPRSSQRL